MTESSSIDQRAFRRILSRNVSIPLLTAAINASIFAALIFYLASAFKQVQETEDVLQAAAEVNKMSVDMQTGLRGFLITGDEEYLWARKLGLEQFEKKFDTLKGMLANNSSQAERIQTLENLHQEWEMYAESVIASRRADGDYRSMVSARGAEKYRQISNVFSALRNEERATLQARSEHAQQAAIVSSVAYLLITFLLTGGLSWMGRRQVLDLSESYGNSLARLSETTEELEQHAWHQSGQAGLAERCMGQSAIPMLGRELLDYLAQHIGVSVGALHVQDTESPDFHRMAVYGIDPAESALGAEGHCGQTLVEEAAISNRLIRLEQVPTNYFKVGSGLGSCSPRTLMLLPTRHNGQPNGVLELAFLHPPEPRVIAFLETISTYVGDTLEMLRNRLRLQESLAETQQLNEELQSQQEELRSTNEELEEQHRALEQSQALLENQKAELEQANEKLSDQAAVLDQRNVALTSIQATLEERARELERASQYKSEFLANMSHELRTPLNSSMILAKLLADNQDGNLTPEQVRSAMSIYAAGNDLLNLINDILDISKVEAGKLDLHPQAVKLRGVVDTAQLVFEPLAKEKQLEMVVDVAADVPETIYTDHQRLEQILKNLLSNAIKFTEAGRVELAVRTQGSDVAFSVKDSGIGISSEQQELIFEAFEQADSSINRHYGGTGLGLAISRDLAELLGGTISVQSTPREGSTFTLVLPPELPEQTVPEQTVPEQRVPEQDMQAPSAPNAEAPVARAVRAPATDAPPTHALAQLTSGDQSEELRDDRDKNISGQRSVLVIEDDPAFAKILYTLAHEQHFHCLVATTAAEGLQMAAEYLPDAILLDIRLPDISGMSVLQKLKVNPITRHIPVHVVSASDQSEAALQMGAVGYVVKPTTRENLQEVFLKIETKLTQKTKRVLLVEDDHLQREAVVALINDADTEITAVATGEEAIELLRHTIFDCMIIDLKLPDMQGMDLLHNMSAGELCSFPPVIVYTGRNLTRDEEKELRKYSRSIIIKGARSPERLLDEVTLFLHKVESELSPERQTMLKTVRGRDRALEGRRVLLVDDDVRNVFALTGALEQKGVIVEIARDGFEALKQVDAIPDIDLVLMDIMMPGMDGLEATRRIRADGRFDQLPIIAITAKAMRDDQEQCLRAGASDYMAKPIDIDRLYSLLRVWMPNVERT